MTPSYALADASPAGAPESLASALALMPSARADTGAASDRLPAASVTDRRLEPLAAFPPPRVRAWQVGLLRPDRLEHAGLSFTLAAALTVAFRDRASAAGLTLALGVAKEFLDSRREGAEAMDLAADAVGLGVALVTVRGRAP